MRLSKGRHLLTASALYAVFAAVIILVLVPLAFLIKSALTKGSPWTAAPFSLFNFSAILTDPIWQSALANSLILAFGSVIQATVTGVALAWLICRTDLPLKRFFESALIIPFFLTSYIGAIAWVILIEPKIGILNQVTNLVLGATPFNAYTIGSMIWVMGLYQTPLVFLLSLATFRGIDGAFEEAAYSTGAGTLRTLRTVTLRLATPGILAAMILTFVSAIENFGIPALMGIPERINIASALIWTDLTNTVPQYGDAAAASMILLAMGLVPIIFYQALTRRSERFVTTHGKATRPFVFPLRSYKIPALAFCTAYLLLSVIIPISTLVFVSFQRFMSFSETSFTLTNYSELFNGQFGTSLLNSIVLAVVGSIACVTIATFLSYTSLKTKLFGRGAIAYVVVLPRALPGIALGVAMLVAYLPTPLYGTFALLVIALVTRFIPFGFYSVSSNMTQISDELIDAARVCGGNRLTQIRRIYLPLLRQGIISAWIFLFVFMISEVSVLILLITNTNIASVQILLNYLNGDLTVVISAATVLTLIIFTVVYVVRKISKVEFSVGGI